MTSTTPIRYPDDLHQNQMDQRQPPEQRPAAARVTTDHATQHQGGGTTGAIGGDRPAETSSSPLVPINGRARLPGDAPPEAFWNTPLTMALQLSHPAGLRLTTLADAGRLVSGEFMTLFPSNALQALAECIVEAARTGSEQDLEVANRRLASYVGAMRLL